MQTRTPAPANKLFGFGSFWSGYLFWPGSQVTPAAPLSTDNVAQLPIIPNKTQEKTASTVSDSSTESPLVAIRKPISRTPSKKMMPEIHALRLIEDYTFFYLDHVTADSPEDEERYQHNKGIILDMVALGKDVLELPSAKTLKAYCESIQLYDVAIRAKRREFNPNLREFEKRTPSFMGKKSKILAYVYFDYLYIYADKKIASKKETEAIDVLRTKESTDAFNTVTTIHIDFTDIHSAVTQMRATVELRARRLNGDDIKKEIELLSKEDKDKWIQKAAKALQPLYTECRKEIKAHPEKFPTQSKSNIEDEYFYDLLFSREPDYFLFTQQCSVEDHEKIEAYAKILDDQLDGYIHERNLRASKHIETTTPIDTQNDNCEKNEEQNNASAFNAIVAEAHTNNNADIIRPFDDKSESSESDPDSESEEGEDDENSDEEQTSASASNPPDTTPLISAQNNSHNNANIGHFFSEHSSTKSVCFSDEDEEEDEEDVRAAENNTRYSPI